MEFIKLTDTGLKIATRQEIYEQLCMFARAAYGNDISLDEGTPFEVFIGMLSDALSTVNGSTQSFSELFSTKELSGTFLDFVAGQRGIIRKSLKNQRVTMTVTVDSNIVRPFLASRNSIFVEDSKGRTWVNTTQLMIQQYKFLPDGNFDTEENFQGTCEFGLLPLDGYDADLLYANNYPALTPMKAVAPSDQTFIDHFSFINKVNATPAVRETETDAQFRARYDEAVYSNAVATVDGLRSNLEKLTDYVRVIENFTDSEVVSEQNPYGLSAHSIWCIVGGGSTAPNYSGTDATVSGDASDVTIAQTILNYKSLGCAVSVSPQVQNGTVVIDGETYNTGNFMVEIPIETIIAQIPFTRLVDNEVTFDIVLYTPASNTDGNLRNTVRSRVDYALRQYVAGLQPGDVITLMDTVNAIQEVLSQYEVGQFDFVSSTPSYAIGTGIAIYQRAVGGSAIAKFSDEE